MFFTVGMSLLCLVECVARQLTLLLCSLELLKTKIINNVSGTWMS